MHAARSLVVRNIQAALIHSNLRPARPAVVALNWRGRRNCAATPESRP